MRGGLEVMENNLDNVKIRKLTPRECSRLMGIGHKIGTFEFDDSDFQKMERINSNTQLYKQFGNSIVVDCLYYIFKPMFDNGKAEEKISEDDSSNFAKKTI